MVMEIMTKLTIANNYYDDVENYKGISINIYIMELVPCLTWRRIFETTIIKRIQLSKPEWIVENNTELWAWILYLYLQRHT